MEIESEVIDLTKQFWKATGVRCLRTFLTTLLAFFTGTSLITEVNWKAALITALSATLYIFILCILAGLPEVDKVEFMECDAIKEAD